MSKKTKPNDCATGFQGKEVFVTGLTKREYFAAIAMQGTIAANDHSSPHHMDKDIASFHAKAAVLLADTLIAELNREAEDEAK